MFEVGVTTQVSPQLLGLEEFPSYQVTEISVFPFGVNLHASFFASQSPLFLPGGETPMYPLELMIPIKAFLSLVVLGFLLLFPTYISMILKVSYKTI